MTYDEDDSPDLDDDDDIQVHLFMLSVCQYDFACQYILTSLKHAHVSYQLLWQLLYLCVLLHMLHILCACHVCKDCIA